MEMNDDEYFYNLKIQGYSQFNIEIKEVKLA